MTLRSFFRTLKLVAAIGVIATLAAACASGTTKSVAPSPARSTSAASAEPAASIPNLAQLPTDRECRFISQDDAAKALGYNPGLPHIDKSGVISGTAKRCAFGSPAYFNPRPYLDISFMKFASPMVANLTLGLIRENLIATYVPGTVKDVAIGDSSVYMPFTDGGTSYVSSHGMIVMILYYRRGTTAEGNKTVLNDLARAVVRHLS